MTRVDEGPIGRYTPTAIALHWLVAVAIVAALALGLSMTDLPLSPRRVRWYNWHKWLGITILALSLVRLAWRFMHPPPPWPASFDAATRRLATAGHRLLYALLFVVPLLGWAYSCATGFPVVYLGWLPLPPLAPVDESLAAVLKVLHRLAAWTLMGLAFGHVAAALRHQWVRRDPVIARMLPGRHR